MATEPADKLVSVTISTKDGGQCTARLNGGALWTAVGGHWLYGNAPPADIEKQIRDALASALPRKHRAPRTPKT